MKVTVKPNSTIVKKTIDELELAPTMGVDIIAIRRNKDWLLDPKPDEKIFQGDILITRGAPIGSPSV